jgi:hypothetical protein
LEIAFMFSGSPCTSNRGTPTALLTVGLFFVVGSLAQAQVGIGGFGIQQVGGVSIDADGLLKNRTIDNQKVLVRELEKALRAVPGDLAKPTEMRKLSLRRLEAAIVAARQTGQPLPDEVRYLAGLQRIRYVFAVPAEQDVIIAGPAEGWHVGPQGEVVGSISGRPVMLLDDLLIALRTVDKAREGGISCSIDPTTDGLARVMQAYFQVASSLTNDSDTANEKADLLEKALGPQNITVTGVPAESHFARVLVAADYRMKRLGMGFEPAPIKNFPSYLAMTKGGAQNLMPRWWLAMNYAGVLAAPDGMAFEIKGAGVKCQVEDEFLNEHGQRQSTGKASANAKKWADMMTARYSELAAKESIFGHLQNCMDLAIVAALVRKEHLLEKANLDTPTLLSASQLPTERYHAPKQVDSKASLLLRSGAWIVSVSGGVQFDSWGLVMNTEPSEKLANLAANAANNQNNDAWWWD